VVASLITAALLWAGAALGQVRELEELRLDQALAMQAEDSLIQERARLLQLGAAVSEVIDSLKLADPQSEAFTEASLYAMELNTELGRLNAELEALAARHDSLRGRLRAAYDWEISRLLGMLLEAWDDGLWQQLTVFQEERQALGYDLAAAQMRYGPSMAISDRDGPEELEEKIELMRDKLRLARRDLSRMEARIAYLSSQVDAVQQLVGRHGVAPPARGALRDMRTARLGADGELRPAELESAGEVPGRHGRLAQPGLGAAEAAQPLPLEASPIPAVRSLQLEISRLKARGQEIREFEAVYVERIQAFESYLHTLLSQPLSGERLRREPE